MKISLRQRSVYENFICDGDAFVVCLTIDRVRFMKEKIVQIYSKTYTEFILLSTWWLFFVWKMMTNKLLFLAFNRNRFMGQRRAKKQHTHTNTNFHIRFALKTFILFSMLVILLVFIKISTFQQFDCYFFLYTLADHNSPSSLHT